MLNAFRPNRDAEGMRRSWVREEEVKVAPATIGMGTSVSIIETPVTELVSTQLNVDRLLLASVEPEPSSWADGRVQSGHEVTLP